MTYESVLQSLGLNPKALKNGSFIVRSPIDGQALTNLREQSPAEVEDAIQKAKESFQIWRNVPAPQRGALIRLYADELRQHKEELGTLVTLENGKILEEGRGEVQEM